MEKRDTYTPVASSIPFDNSTNGFLSDDTQGAVEETKQLVSVSASPGWSFGRNGNLNAGTYLYRPGSIVSSGTGITIGLLNPILRKIMVGTTTLDAFDIDIMLHDGNSTNLTVAATISIPGGSYLYTIDRSDPLIYNKAMAVRVSPTSPNSSKDLGVDLQLSGSVAI
jgi:hypothetical protein